MTKKGSQYKYLEADKYFVVNNGDIDLNPVYISLPEPPPAHTIDGYGVNPEDQVFERLTIPRRLLDLEQEAINATKEDLSSNKNNVVTLLKIQRNFWKLLQERNKDYVKEIAFIRRVWYHRIKGYWFYNNGKPTFISGWHFFYLNFWTMDVKGKVSFPDYRDRDRKEFLYKLYQITTTETFARLDSSGKAIPEENGRYKMIDTGRRVCYGVIQPKNRRSGNTNKALSDGIEIVSRTIGTDGGGIQSYSDDNAGSHFRDKLMPAYFRMPIWLQPFTTSGRTSGTLKFDVEKNAYGDESLGTLFDYATTSSSKFYDGKKKKFLLTDEAGKCFGLNTKIRMYDGGWKYVQDIKIGDVLMGDDSTPRNVLKLARGVDEMYRIIPNKGETWTCNSEHILPLKASDKAIPGVTKGAYFKKTIKEYLQMKSAYKNCSVLYRRGVKYLEQEHKLEPYFVGLWLGDGSKDGAAITNIDKEILDYLEDFALYNGLSVIRRDDVTVYLKGGQKKHEFNVTSELRSLNLLYNKHIPKSYLMDSYENRLELLAGLIDSDGYASTGNQRAYEITQKRKKLSEDIRRLALDLGFYVNMRPKLATMRREDGSMYESTVYRISIYGLDLWKIPCKVSRKRYERKKIHPNTRNPLHTGFSIESIGKGDYYGFVLDGNRKFLLEDNTVAHNTSSVTDVGERHEINKHTIAQGDGADIHGFMEYPSTVEELKEGAFHYRRLAEGSNFYVRQENGQTESGLFRIFIPADEGLDRYIDKYGNSVKGDLSEHHKKMGFTKTATDHLNARRDFLLNKGDSESMKLYRDYKKLFPLKYEDCFLGEAGSLGFNHEKLDQRQSELRRYNPCIKGNLRWVNDIFCGSVEFIPDEDEGRWTFDELPPNHVINKVVEVNMFNPLTGKIEPQKRPMFGNLFVIGTDTFNFLGKQQQQAGKKTTSSSSKHSDGGMSMLLKYDASVDMGKPMSDWKTHKFVMSYRNRHGSTYDFNEDVLMTAIFTGGMVFPEMNLTNTYEYFLIHGYGGFMLYALDKFTGQYKDKPGVSSLEGSKQEIFSGLRDYIEHRIHVDNMYDLQKELREIKDMSAMRYYDLLASAGVCLIGAKSQYVEEMFGGVEEPPDIEDYLDFFDI